MSDSLQPHELQHARVLCPSLSPGGCSNSCPLSRWCHPTVSSSATSFCPQSFPTLGSLPVSWLFASGGQSTELQYSPSNEYSGLISFRIDWFDLLAVQRILKSLLSLLQHNSKISTLQCSAFFVVQLSHLYVTTTKTSFNYMDLCWQIDISPL